MKLKRVLPVAVLVLMAARTAKAGGVPTGAITYGLSGVESDLYDFGKALATFLSPLATGIGGGKAALAAARHEDWVKPLLFAVVGAAFFAALSL